MEVLVTIWNGKTKVSFRQFTEDKEKLRMQIFDLVDFATNIKIEDLENGAEEKEMKGGRL